MTKRLVALFSAAVIVLAACGPGATTAPAGSTAPQGSGPAATGGTGALAADQTLRQYLSDTDPPDMNPALAQDSVSISVRPEPRVGPGHVRRAVRRLHAREDAESAEARVNGYWGGNL